MSERSPRPRCAARGERRRWNDSAHQCQNQKNTYIGKYVLVSTFKIIVKQAIFAVRHLILHMLSVFEVPVFDSASTFP
jgi:hypothetical protein